MSQPDGMPGWRPLITVLCWPNNIVTIARVVLIGLMLLSLHLGMSWDPLIASVLFMLGFWYMDSLDGWLARRLKLTSSFGESMDLAADCVCDLLVCSFILTSRPEYAGVVIFFLLGRFGPDVLVIRYGGLTSGIYATLMQKALQEFLPKKIGVRKTDTDWAIEAYCLSKSIFFCGALFWAIPVWAGILIVVPAIIFIALSVVVMRFHTRDVLAQRAQADQP